MGIGVPGLEGLPNVLHVPSAQTPGDHGRSTVEGYELSRRRGWLLYWLSTSLVPRPTHGTWKWAWSHLAKFPYVLRSAVLISGRRITFVHCVVIYRVNSVAV